MNIKIKIALPIASDNLFSYNLDFDSKDTSLIGRRALVPFGKRSLTGIIVDFDDTIDTNFNIKNVIELLDEKPVFDDNMLRLCKWIADYYFCSYGESLKAALPQGMSPQSVLKISIQKVLNKEELEQLNKRAPKRYLLLKELMEHSGPITLGYLEQRLGVDSVSAQVNALEEAGIIFCERVIEKQVKEKIIKAYRIPKSIIHDEKSLATIFDELDRNAPKQADLLSKIFISQKNGLEQVPAKHLNEDNSSVYSVLKALIKKGYIEEHCIQENRNALFQAGGLAKKNEALLQLTDEQEYCSNELKKALDKDDFSVYLLKGVTGSGKTLVYIHAIEHCLNHGRNALLLVPEIALTPQLIDRFSMAFPGKLAVFHSKMSQGERFDAWKSASEGKARIVIGARSGLFAPLKNIGLIVVDEEHESSYKQESPSPRYHARDCAIMRGKIENSIVLLGSATPSVESMQNVLNKRFKLLEINKRADNAQLPEIKLIDIKKERKSLRMIGSISQDLYDKIEDRIRKKEGVIIFQNMRGFASYLECPDCASIQMCKNCAVTLTYHKSSNQLRCHYCGYSATAHHSCKVCGFAKLNEVGAGTQKIEEEIQKYFAIKNLEPVIQRMDLDTTSKKGSHRNILQKFSDGEIDVLVGTQMVAKGLDFDRVTLVAVINADLQLFLPDFRASERTFQLLSQVSGRAGRSGKLKGEVLIQTSHPDNQSILKAVDNDYLGFFKLESLERMKTQFPPFSRLCLIEFSGEDFDKVNKQSMLFFQSIPQHESVLKYGPNFPQIPKKMNLHLKQIIIKGLKDKDPNGYFLKLAIKSAVEHYEKNFSTSSVRYYIDPDTYSGN